VSLPNDLPQGAYLVKMRPVFMSDGHAVSDTLVFWIGGRVGNFEAEQASETAVPFLQTGITFKYFTGYYMNAYNPLLGEFYVQNRKELGAFPMLDFFINTKVRQTRIYLKAEHFNSSFTGNTFYAAPNYPYRDFVIRFGLVWNFFS
jgi:hypothetical protein